MATAVKEKRRIVRKVEGVCALFSDNTIRLDNVRLSYPWVGKAQKNTDDDGNETWTYSCVALLDKDTHIEAMKMCRDAVVRLEKTKPADKNGKPFKVPASKRFIKNGDAVDEDGDRLYGPEGEGMWMVSSRERNRPLLRGPKKDPKTGKAQRLTPEQATSMFYGGCYGTVLIRPWLMDNKYGKRINAGLVAVQFLRDGEPFGEGRIGEDDADESFDGEDAGDDTGGWDEEDDDM